MGRIRKGFVDLRQISVTTKVDAEMYKRILFVVEKKDLSLSQVTRTAIKEYVERFEKSRRVAA